jgi:hypothetical protein
VPPNPALQSDRFARKIVQFLKPSNSARSRRLNAKPLGGNHQSEQRDNAKWR